MGRNSRTLAEASCRRQQEAALAGTVASPDWKGAMSAHLLLPTTVGSDCEEVLPEPLYLNSTKQATPPSRERHLMWIPPKAKSQTAIPMAPHDTQWFPAVSCE
eukprot:5067086-Alexandrium_andersonii.AAC.1